MDGRTSRPAGRRTGATAALAALVAVLLSVVVGGASPAAAAKNRPGSSTTTTTTTSTTTSTTTTTAPAVRSFGVFVPGLPWDTSGLQRVAAETGRMPDRAMWYAAWSYGEDFPAAAAAKVAALGATPEITWEPWDPARGVDQPAYSLDRIAAGAFDTYVSRWAQQIKAYGKPVVLRFAHEMNGSWYPWAEGVNGNGAGDYVAAWKRVRSVFTRAKVTNVTWSWSPNVSYWGSVPLRGLYPGDSLVDDVAVDGYNWSTLLEGTRWTSFADLFTATFAEIRAFSTEPLRIGEVGSTEVGGDKAAWVDGMFATLAQRTDVTGFTWFDVAKEADWRISSSQGSQDAFRRGVASFR